MKYISNKYFLRLFILFNLFALPVCLYAASFNCGKALGDIERSICHEPELSKLDDKLTVTYKKALKYSPNPKSIKTEQRKWLHEIRNRCNTNDCIKAVYTERINKLVITANSARPPRGTFKCSFTTRINNDNENEDRNLEFKIENNKILEFSWNASWTPKGDYDLRPGFHYSSHFSLSRMRQELIYDHIRLVVKGKCEVRISQHGNRLHVYTTGCESFPSTANFDYLFHQNGSKCRLVSKLEGSD